MLSEEFVSTPPRDLLRRLSARLSAFRALRKARSHSGERARALEFRRILVLCYGNIYRSPLAEACLKREMGDIHGCEVRSAGFHPRSGRPSPAEYVSLVMKRSCLDLSSHRSRVVQRDDLEWADVIVIMDRHNWHALDLMGLPFSDRTVWLGAFLTSSAAEIADPYGNGQLMAESIVDQIVAASRSLVGTLKSVKHQRGANQTE